jgi:hypothetical protein
MERKGFKEEEGAPKGGHHATGDLVNAAPGSMSAREVLEANRTYWDPARGSIGNPQVLTDTPTKGTPQGVVHQTPASNLKAGPTSVAELAAKSSSGVYRNVSKPVPLTLSAEPKVDSTHD